MRIELRWRAILALLGMLVFGANAVAAPHGRLLRITVHSSALEHNHVNDSADRDVSIYLPPDYDSETRRYPVLYLLHGYSGTDQGWTNPSYVDVPATMDRLLARHAIAAMIVVMPNSFNRFGGSMYANSSLSGGWEDFVVRDLVAYVDAHYRTIPLASGRGIAGHSMGGYGALKLGLRHPEVFGAAYGMSACCAEWSDELLPDAKTMGQLRAAKNLAEIVADGMDAQMTLAMAAAFSPDLANPPLDVDWPLDATNLPVPAVIARWKLQMLDAIVPAYARGSEHLHAIGFDVGKRDEDHEILLGSRSLDAQMTRLGIVHNYFEYDGTHASRIAERMEKFVLPFMSRAFAEQSAGASQKPVGF